MKKLCILAVISMLAIVATEGICSPVLISVELPTMESKKAWHQMKIPTYELIGNMAIAEADESQISMIKQKGYQINVIDRQPDLIKYVVVSNIARIPELPGTSIWQNDKTAIIKGVSKDLVKDAKYKHQIRPLNTKPLGDRFWTSVTTKYVPVKSIPYNPFIQSLVDQVNADSIAATIQRLQDFQTRFVFTDSSYAASAWLKQKIESMGLIAEYDSFYIDSWAGTGFERNVIGTINGNIVPSREIVVGGHFDSACEGDYLSFAPGADDDASGTAAAIEIGRIIKNYPLESTLKISCWGAEELWMVGSEHYAAWADSNNIDIYGVVSMDMIGYMNDSALDLFVGRNDSSCQWLADLYTQCAKVYVPSLVIYPDDWVSDDLSFAENGYSAIGLIEYPEVWDGSNPNYHQITDLLSTLSPELFAGITKASIATIGMLGIYPGSVKDVAVMDLGEGTKLVVNWIPNAESDVIGYWVYYGIQSETYTDSIFVNGISACVDTIEYLSPDTTYFLSVRAQDAETHKSLAAIEITGTPRIAPVAPSGITLEPIISGLKITWLSNTELDVAGYRIYRKTDQGTWDSLNVSLMPDTVCIDIVPENESIYWYCLRAYDASGYYSALSDSFCGYTYIAMSPSAIPLLGGIRLDCLYDSTKDIAGYNVYRKINDGTYDSLTSTFDTSFVDSPLSGANRYYYKMRAFDTDGKYSQLSDSVYGRPITLDQGILVVDETNNWTAGSYPRDVQQDSFYNYILSGYNIIPYEYGSSDQKPILADFGPYSTVAWFADDYTTLLASGAMEDHKVYLDNGGKLWFTGWKATGDIRNNANSYPADFTSGSFIYDYLKVSHVSLSAYTDSFQTASGLLGYPSMAVEPLKVPISTWLGTMRYIESLTPVSTGEGIYTMDMKNDGSPYESQVCAVRDSGKAVLFGFPLYFMDKDQAKAAAQQVMAEFGEPSGVATERPGDNERPPVFKLYQNAPNPFNKQTTISYQLPVTCIVTLNIYNITGQLVKTLINQEQPAGSYTAKWDGRDNQNKQASAGVYFCRLTAGEQHKSIRFILIK